MDTGFEEREERSKYEKCLTCLWEYYCDWKTDACNYRPDKTEK